MKTGRFNVSEINYLYQNAEKLSVDVMAKKLNRDPASVHTWIKKNVGLTSKDKEEVAAKNELKSRPYYKELQRQFSSEELEMFDYHFKKMWIQFKDDVFHTEEMQIVDTIKLEILMNRSLRSQQATADKIDELEREVQREKNMELDGDPDSRNKIINLERQIGMLRASQENLSKDFKDLQTKKASMLKELKGTREQRIKQIEDSKQTFATLLTTLTTNPKYRKEIGYEMERMRLAMEEETKRLSQDITYDDGVIDKPLLSSKSVFVED
jgi:hypothetical protein